MTKETILKQLPSDFPWRDRICWFDTIDSTNNHAKALARQGAPHGTVVIAGHQSAGRGRLGRSFSSPAGMGVYLSVILRPACPPDRLMHLTCGAGVAMCQAVERCCGITPSLKWINDLVVHQKKLGGILTELSVDPITGNVDFAVVGIGINCAHTVEDFPPDIRQMATSLKLLTGRDISVASLAAQMICSLSQMDWEPKTVMAAYRERCITLGKPVQLHRADSVQEATALDVDDQGALLVEFADGSREWVQSGEAHVRGLYGYL